MEIQHSKPATPTIKENGASLDEFQKQVEAQNGDIPLENINPKPGSGILELTESNYPVIFGLALHSFFGLRASEIRNIKRIN
jgi:hypothetical protein